MSRHDSNHYFRLESEELISGLEAGLLAHGSAAFDLSELFRKAHTLKGAARVVGQEAISDLAHTLEDVLEQHRETGEPFAQQELGELLQLVDALRRMLPAAANDNTQPAPRSLAPRELNRLRIDPADMDELTAGVLGAEVHASTVRRHVDALSDLRRLTQSLVDQAATQADARAVPPRLRAGLDELRAGLDEQRAQLANLADQLELDLRQLGERAADMRLVEVALLFPELERCVHDAAQALGRSVSFSAYSASVRVDGHIIAVLRGALLHLVRNAVAHGIEDATERLVRGKPATGSVRIEVRHDGPRIRIAVHDDGRGIDRDAVRRAAERRGLTDAGRGERSVEDWIFEPGLSTAREVSAIAGRGVGLDAVREAVERCKGRIHVRSQAGAGCTFELEVPVSLSALSALCVEVAGRNVLLPLSAVSATLRVSERDVIARDGDACIVHEGQAVPYRCLGQTLSVAARAEVRVALIVQSRGRALALGVEALRSTRDVIVRSLPRVLGAAPLFLGATFDASGNPELVLDPDALGGAPLRAAAPSEQSAARKPILIIDDSLTTRMLEQSILDAAGYEVDLASSAEEGMQKALARDFGLIVVDVEMPGMNGFEFTQLARSTPKLATLPIIMVTSLASDGNRSRARQAGVSAYIVKGEFDQKRFLSKVAELLP